MWDQYNIGLLCVLIAGVIGFVALARETDDLHRLLLLDLVEITALGVIALLGTDLAEALVLPGLTVGIAELLALSQTTMHLGTTIVAHPGGIIDEILYNTRGLDTVVEPTILLIAFAIASYLYRKVG